MFEERFTVMIDRHLLVIPCSPNPNMSLEYDIHPSAPLSNFSFRPLRMNVNIGGTISRAIDRMSSAAEMGLEKKIPGLPSLMSKD